MASKTGITIEGLPELRSALRRLASGMTEGADAGQDATAELIADDWRENAPVDTGEYRDSIDHDADGAFATAVHAPFPEFGTSTQAAQPAGTMAAERGRSAMPALVAREIKRRLP